MNDESTRDPLGPPPLEPPAQPPAPTPSLESTDDTAALSITSLTNPVFALLTPEFWELIEERASRRTFPDWNTPSAVAAFTESLKYRNGTVLLSEIANALGIDAEFARPYLRALHKHFRAAGIEIRERRLKADGAIGTYAYFPGEFMWPKDKNALYQERAALKRAVRTARADAKANPSLESTLALQKAMDALDEGEAAVAEMTRTTEYLPVERHAYLIVLDQSQYVSTVASAA